LDIETAPTIAYVWRLYDENIGVDQIIKPTRITCWSAKWVGKKDVIFSSEWTDSRKGMLKKILSLLSAADAVITYNGDKFDLPKLMGEFAVEGLGSPGPLTSIDLYKTVRKLGFQSSKLQFAAPHLGIGEKVANEGFRLWRGIEEGDEKARRKMERYNKQDTRLLEKLYSTLRPYVKNHPYLGVGSPSECPACGSHDVQKRGIRRTKSFFIERLHCQACGTWSDGKRSKVP
jgi:uncharacterized protein YprB with RNaseH-like and TPR domain